MPQLQTVYDSSTKTLHLVDDALLLIANNLRKREQTLEAYKVLLSYKDSLIAVNLEQLAMSNNSRIRQRKMIEALNDKNRSYEAVTDNYRNLIARRDSIYNITEKRFTEEIALERRKVKSFFGNFKDKIAYLAVGVLVGIIIK